MWAYYTSVYVPSLSYPLSLAMLTPHQCHWIGSSFAQGIMQCTENRCSMSLTIWNGPSKIEGLRFYHSLQEQYQCKILLVVTQLHTISIFCSPWVQAFVIIGFSILNGFKTNSVYTTLLFLQFDRGTELSQQLSDIGKADDATSIVPKWQVHHGYCPWIWILQTPADCIH